MDYNTLIGTNTTAGSIANWGNSSKLSPAAPTIIQEAEAWVFRRLRTPRMLSVAVGTMAIGTATFALPTSFLEPKTLWITGTAYAEVELKTQEEVAASYDYDGSGNRVPQQPQIYYFDGSNVNMDSPPDQAYPYAFTFYQQPTPLSATNTANFVTQYFPRLMRLACMVAACEFMKDSGQGNIDRNYWAQLAENEMATVQVEADESQRGAGINQAAIVV